MSKKAVRSAIRVAKKLRRGPKLDIDKYPTSYLSNVGRQVMAEGGPIPSAAAPSPQPNELGLYSHGAYVAANLPQPRGTPQQFRSMLEKQGVKPDEFEHSGWNDAFVNRPSVTREEVAQHFQQNSPMLQETTLGSRGVPYSTPDEWQNAITAAERAGNFDLAQQLNLDWESYEGLGGEGATKFTKYTIPGGENYRETLLTLPETNSNKPVSFSFRRGEGMRRLDSENYRSSHWNEPNVLAHLRMSDRVGSNGEKTLHIEEIQSDWGQEGKKKGFQVPKEQYDATLQDVQNARSKLIDYYKSLPDRHRPTDSEIEGEISRMIDGKMPAFINEEGEAKPLINQFMSTYRKLNDYAFRIPSAPYVTNTAKWTDLALKRALNEAVKGDYDAIAITPGKEQAKRYDLSKQIDSLHYAPSANGESASIEAYKGGQNVLNRPNVSMKDLPSVIGKEVAEKITKGAGEINSETGYRVLSGLDLSVGGEGMIGYYDNIVPKQLNKLVQKMDSSAKVRLHHTPVHEDHAPAHYLPITDKMRETIRRGLPMFARGGEVAEGLTFGEPEEYEVGSSVVGQDDAPSPISSPIHTIPSSSPMSFLKTSKKEKIKTNKPNAKASDNSSVRKALVLTSSASNGRANRGTPR